MGISLNISLTQVPGRRRDGQPDSNTPLINSRGNNILIFRPATPTNNQQTVINASLNELATSRATVIALIVVNLPQIIATAIVLGLHWSDTTVCNQENRSKWDWWALISASRMFIYTGIVILMYYFKAFIESRSWMAQATNIRNIVDGLGLIWYSPHFKY